MTHPLKTLHAFWFAAAPADPSVEIGSLQGALQSGGEQKLRLAFRTEERALLHAAVQGTREHETQNEHGNDAQGSELDPEIEVSQLLEECAAAGVGVALRMPRRLRQEF